MLEGRATAARGPRRPGTIAAAALLAASAFASQALAQGGPNPPPRQDTVSPAGVSLATGAFNHSERDLSIGGGAFPNGLVLERTYLSSLASVFTQYSGYGPQGWSSNLNMRVGNSPVGLPGTSYPPAQQPYLYSVSIGNRSVGFTGGSTNPTGGFVGTYEPVYPGGEILEFGGGDHSTGHFTFTDSDGTKYEFNSQAAGGTAAMQVASITAPDGTRADFTYDGDGLRSMIGNRGYALLFEYGSVAGGRARIKACAVNMAATHVTALSACPAGAQTVTYQYSTAGSTETGPILMSVTNAAQHTTSYGYTAQLHLRCITLPGQSACQVENVYSECVPPPPPPIYNCQNQTTVGFCELEEDPNPTTETPPDMRIHEQVLSQTTATGETYSYSFPLTRTCPPQNGDIVTPVTMTASSTSQPGLTAATTVTMNSENVPESITDPLGRTTGYVYTGRPSWVALGGTNGTLAQVERPEQNRLNYGYDARGNLTLERLTPKPASNQGETLIERTAFYAQNCGNRFTCNRPEYVIDARVKRTDFDYDPTHGGVLSETGPADPNNVRPQVRYTYQQRHAWIRNASSGYSQVATPVWLRVSESRCRTSAATGNPAAPCALANDEVLTLYDYGPNSGPNNLLLRGQLVSGAGVSARTCFGYDANGNRISETGPGAQLGSCQ
jgi:YD repeat-containing protein